MFVWVGVSVSVGVGVDACVRACVRACGVSEACGRAVGRAHRLCERTAGDGPHHSSWVEVCRWDVCACLRGSPCACGRVCVSTYAVSYTHLRAHET